MSFSGSGAGRFQIRRLRNGSTAESLITADDPLFQDYSEPTGQHSPNWDNRFEGADVGNHPATTTISGSVYTEFQGGLYKLETGGTASTAPTAGETDSNWEYEGPIGEPLTLTPSLLVNGVTVDTVGPTFTRAGSPVNAQVTNITWYALVSGTATATAAASAASVPTATANVAAIGSWKAVDTSLNGFTLNTNGSLDITRNLDTATDFGTTASTALQNNMIQLRCRISYNVTGVLDASNNLQTLTSDSFVTVRRNVLTESSMFARIYLREISGQAGSTAEIWNSGFTGNKTFRADLIIGASVANDAADYPVTYQWYNSNGIMSGATSRDLTVTRANVNTSETYHCIITDTNTNMSYTTNSIELRDFLDPVQFVEVGTSTVDTGANGQLTVIPYQNGAPMNGLTASNTQFNFEIRRQANATDMTGTRIAWITTAAAGGFTAANRFEGTQASSYVADTDPALTNGIARTAYDSTIMGATIYISDTEMGAFGCYIDYDVVFSNVAN